MILINGNLEHRIDVSDRGLQYGDGLYETIAVRQGQPVRLPAHLTRLKMGCERLAIPVQTLDALTDEIAQIVRGSSSAILKVIVTRGIGSRGYRQPEIIQPTRIISLHPFPDYPDSYQQQGINIRFCKTRLGLNPDLAGIKHLNRLEQVLARAEWTDPAIQEGLLSDVLGRVIEGTMSNLFFVKTNVLYTAPVTQSGVAGIMRDLVMELAQLHKIPVEQRFFDHERLMTADEIFVTNSIIGIWPVKRLQELRFEVGPISRRFMAWLA